MRRSLVAGNWKMNGSRESIDRLLAGLSEIQTTVEIAVFPPHIYIPQVVSALRGSSIDVGAQNVSEYQAGAYTGEIAAEMLQDVGCRYVLVGHSERRSLFGEDDRQIAEKFVTSQSAGLIPVLCVGETLEERVAEKTLAVITAQLCAVLERAGLESVCNGVIAYEPVWAIGTGKTASAEQAQEIHREIRQQLGEPGMKTRILYGGSVKAANATELFSQQDVDGALVGGASLDSDEFREICKKAHVAN